jgi:hypothetical protein
MRIPDALKPDAVYWVGWEYGYELWTGKDVKGSDCGLFEDIMAFSWKDWRNPKGTCGIWPLGPEANLASPEFETACHNVGICWFGCMLLH